jgi:hypothetical protein
MRITYTSKGVMEMLSMEENTLFEAKYESSSKTSLAK